MNYRVIHISITSTCNMRCPNCCYGMNWRSHVYSDIELLKSDVAHFKTLQEFTITGGEPTTHPNFGEIVQLLRDELPGLEMRIETNGLLYEKWKSFFQMFDLINVTHYTKDSWSGCLDNTRMVEVISKNHKSVRVIPIVHLENNKSPKLSTPCGRHDRPHYSQKLQGGLIYGCCIGPGAVGSVGVPVSDKWQEDLSNIILPCSTCVFGIPKVI